MVSQKTVDRHSLSDHCIVNPSMASSADSHLTFPRENSFPEHRGYSSSNHHIINPSVALNVSSISALNGQNGEIAHTVINPSMALTFADSRSTVACESGI